MAQGAAGQPLEAMVVRSPHIRLFFATRSYWVSIEVGRAENVP